MRNMVLLIICGLCMAFSAFFVFENSEITQYQNSGKIVFETVEDYGQFKRLMGNEAVAIEDVLVLSSEPPIVVEFTVKRQAGFEFPYGKSSPRSGSLD